MIILVTGATGRLGSLLIKKLLKNKYEVYGISKKSSKVSFANNSKYKHIKLDLRNKKKLYLEILKIKPVVIYHLAAYIPKSEKKSCYIDSLRNNLICTQNILYATEKLNCLKKFIFASSISVNGKINNKFKRNSENDKVIPDGFYGLHKLKSEIELERWTIKTKKIAITIRLSGMHGKDRKSGVIYNFYKSAVINKKIVVKKPYYYYSFLFFEDAVNACYSILEKQKISGYNLYNISGMHIINLKDLASKIKNNLENKGRVLLKISCDNIVNYSTLSIKKALNELDWKPKSFDLRLVETCKYWNKNEFRK